MAQAHDQSSMALLPQADPSNQPTMQQHPTQHQPMIQFQSTDQETRSNIISTTTKVPELRC